jgi:stage III sporulation protein AG
MDMNSIKTRITEAFSKYKILLFVLLIGIIFMVLPTSKNKTEDVPKEEIIHTKTLGEELAAILCLIEGAGDVRVLLTEASGEQTIYQSDEDTSSGNNTTSQRNKTVIITNKDKAQIGLVKQINPPQYLGAVIICKGADKPTVQLAIVDAVSKITGLSSDKIAVIKMK